MSSADESRSVYVLCIYQDSRFTQFHEVADSMVNHSYYHAAIHPFYSLEDLMRRKDQLGIQMLERRDAYGLLTIEPIRGKLSGLFVLDLHCNT